MTKNIPDPNTYTDIEKVRDLMKNADRLGNSDVVKACFRRICELEGKNFDDPVVRRFWEAVAAVEQCLFKQHGRKVQASYTRRKAKNVGERQTLADWALKPQSTEGFKLLIDDGLAEFTGEYVVVEFPDEFPENVVNAARKRLIDHGYVFQA